MKKLFAITLTIIVCFTCVGCSSSNTTNESILTQTNSTNKTTSKTESEPSSKTVSATSSKIESSSSSVSGTVSSEVEGTTLEDGSILFYEKEPSKTASINFIDENGVTLLDVNDVATVSALFLSGEGYALQFNFDEEGTQKFKTATEENLGKIIYMQISEDIVLSPVVNAVITDGKTVVINPEISKEELFELYNSLT